MNVSHRQLSRQSHRVNVESRSGYGHIHLVNELHALYQYYYVMRVIVTQRKPIVLKHQLIRYLQQHYPNHPLLYQIMHLMTQVRHLIERKFEMKLDEHERFDWHSVILFLQLILEQHHNQI